MDASYSFFCISHITTVNSNTNICPRVLAVVVYIFEVINIKILTCQIIELPF